MKSKHRDKPQRLAARNDGRRIVEKDLHRVPGLQEHEKREDGAGDEGFNEEGHNYSHARLLLRLNRVLPQGVMMGWVAIITRLGSLYPFFSYCVGLMVLSSVNISILNAIISMEPISKDRIGKKNSIFFFFN